MRDASRGCGRAEGGRGDLEKRRGRSTPGGPWPVEGAGSRKGGGRKVLCGDVHEDRVVGLLPMPLGSPFSHSLRAICTVLLDPRDPLLHSERTQSFAADPDYWKGEVFAYVGLPQNLKDQREFFIDNLLVQIYRCFWWTGLAPWEFGFPFPVSRISTFLANARKGSRVIRGDRALILPGIAKEWWRGCWRGR